MCSWSMMTDLGHLEQAGAGRSHVPRQPPCIAPRVCVSSTGIAVDEAPLPARSSSTRSDQGVIQCVRWLSSPKVCGAAYMQAKLEREV